MDTVSDIFDEIGGPGKVAEWLDVKPSTASEMKRRQSIPAWHWQKLVDACREHGVRGINFDLLVALHQKKDTAA
jgi:hypothetical protein